MLQFDVLCTIGNSGSALDAAALILCPVIARLIALIDAKKATDIVRRFMFR